VAFLKTVFDLLSASPALWFAIIVIVFAMGGAAVASFVAFTVREKRAIERAMSIWIAGAGKPLERLIDSMAQARECQDSLILRVLEKIGRIPPGITTAQRDLNVWLENEFWAKLMFADYVSGVLILFGLLGTLFGLSGTVRELGGAAAALSTGLKDPTKGSSSTFEAVQGLLDAWNKAMGHTSSAFTASLTAVFSTVVFVLILSLVRRQAQRTLGDLQTFLAVDVFPKLGTLDVNTQLDSLVRTLGEHVVILSDLKAKVIELIADKQLDFQFVATLLQKGDERSAQLGERMDKLISGQAAATDSIESLVGGVREELKQSQELYASGRNAYAAWDTRSREADTAIHVVIKDLRDAVESIQKFFETAAAGSMTGAFNELIKKVSEQTRDFNKFGNDVTQMTSAIQGGNVTLSSIEQVMLAQEHAGYAEKVLERIGDLATQLPAGDKWKDLFANVEEVRNGLKTLDTTTSAFDKASSQLGAAATAFSGLSQSQGSMLSDIQQLKKLIDDLNMKTLQVCMELREGKLDTISKTSGRSLDLMENRISPLLKTISQSPGLKERRSRWWLFARNSDGKN
jgi:hypothetical protein